MSRIRAGIAVLGSIVALGTIAPARAQAPPKPPLAEQTTVTVVAPLQYIKAGQTLSIVVADEPDLTHDYKVGTDGQIQMTIPGADAASARTWRVSVLGKTEEQARTAVVASLQAYLRDPQVQIHIVPLPRLSVEIRGAAEKTGLFSVAAETTLAEAMALCKYHPDADLAHVIIMRKPPDPPTTVGEHSGPPAEPTNLRIDFLAFLHGDSDDDPHLVNGDIVIIPLKTDAHPATLPMVRVVGEVNTESSIPWSTGLHVKDALERAGGLKTTADNEHIRLIRGIDGKIVMIDWSRPDAEHSVYNTELGPGDLIIVTARDQSQAYAVVGEVVTQRKAVYPSGAHIMLSQALHEAGGPSRNGDPHNGILRRGYLLNPATARDIHFDPERILYHQVADVDLLPGDVVVVMPKQKRPGFLQQVMPLLLRFLPL